MHAHPFSPNGVLPYSQSHPMSSMRSVWLLNVETIPESHLVAATALQGLANRSGPQVYLHVTDRHWAMKLSPALQTDSLRDCSDIWLDYSSKAHSLEFTPVPNLETLLEKVQQDVTGAIRRPGVRARPHQDERHNQSQPSVCFHDSPPLTEQSKLASNLEPPTY